MKISLGWLKEILGTDIPASPQELAEKLFTLGFEVSSIQAYPKVTGVVAAKILELSRHPNADKLRLAKVTDGKVTDTVVCGAPNIEQGQVVFWAQLGAALAEGLTIKKANIRGVDSPGMLCSLKELGVGDSHDGIWILDEKTPLGTSSESVADFEDSVLDIEVTPNRPDALSVTGIAREVAAAYGLKWAPPQYKYEAHAALPFYPVEIEDKGGCVRYIAKKIINVSVKPSSPKIQARLIRSGIRPINNIVDITNYVLLETGQPLHAFDADKLEGGKIIVRRAREKEKILALDGKTYPLDTDILIIADSKRPVAIAGVMGGQDTAVTDATKNILLESAIFSRGLVRYGRNKLKLSSESSYRFERGVSRWSVQAGSDEAESLLEQTAGGKISAFSDVQSNPDEKVPGIAVHNAYIERLLGEKIPVSEIAQIFQRLGISVESSNVDGLNVLPPAWRLDLEIEADYAEEIARVRGYQKIPSRGLAATLPLSQGRAHKVHALDRVRSVFSALGFDEALNYGLVSVESAEALQAKDSLVELENPLASDQSVLRPALALELLANLKSNLSYQKTEVRLYEAGTVFRREGGRVIESLHAGAVAAGKSLDATWQFKKPSDIDFYWIKGVAEQVLGRAGVAAHFVKSEAILSKILHPVFSMAVLDGKNKALGVFGLIHPRTAQKLGLPANTAVLEMDLAFLEADSGVRPVRKISFLPEIERDCSLWMKAETSWEAVRSEILGALAQDLKACRLFDVYEDASKPGHKSLSFTLTFQHPEKTLSDDEANALRDKAVAALSKKFGAELRKK